MFAERPNHRITESPNHRITELGYGENEKLQKILKRICEDYKITGLQDYRITGLQDEIAAKAGRLQKRRKRLKNRRKTPDQKSARCSAESAKSKT
jgi:predicted nucleic acid-binding protein